MEFRWIPGESTNADAIQRMKLQFPKPLQDPREAWFMSAKQRYWHGLFEALTIEPTDISYVEHYLADTGGGIKSFGRFQEWVEWFQYLFPYLLERRYEGELLLLTIDHFFNVYSEGIEEVYLGFRTDVFNTFAKSVMANHLWTAEDLATDHWWFDDRAGYWDPAFSASMFFCIKYLEPGEIRSWVKSIADIQGERWRERVFHWLKGAEQFFHSSPISDDLSEEVQRDDIEKRLEAAKINWNGAYLIFSGLTPFKAISDFLPQKNIDMFWEEVVKHKLLAKE